MSYHSFDLQGSALLHLLAACPTDIGSWHLRLITSRFITLVVALLVVLPVWFHVSWVPVGAVATLRPGHDSQAMLTQAISSAALSLELHPNTSTTLAFCTAQSSAPSGSCLALVDHTASTITSSFRSLLSQIKPCGVGGCFPGTDTREWNCGIIGYILRWSLIYLQSHCYQFILYCCTPRLILKIVKLYQVGQSDGCETDILVLLSIFLAYWPYLFCEFPVHIFDFFFIIFFFFWIYISKCLVSLGCHNKIPYTGWFTREKFIFSQLGSQERPRSRCPPEGCLVRALLWSCRQSCCVFTWPFLDVSMWRVKDLPLILLMRPPILSDYDHLT